MGIGDALTSAAIGIAADLTGKAMDMDMDMDTGAECKISMLWNWYTVDACFLSSSWHIKSKGMFAGSCIGVILLVMTLEALRRASKEYDRLILRQYQRSYTPAPVVTVNGNGDPNRTADQSGSDAEKEGAVAGNRAAAIPPFRPHIVQQMVRATLHMLQFAVAYFIMLLAMYFNGYIIICIIIGAWLGGFVFTWETVSLSGLSPQEEASKCCG
ncbi:related to copper transport protein [Phialocephala subalpina]|uniref:Copper transport protein n=1 Tax=Phialocephala subalpina TaxID=576137 RepID=A0A1L7WCS1_9HELO|nr:related to copper transport protein [Phialocephala subalpina]